MLHEADGTPKSEEKTCPLFFWIHISLNSSIHKKVNQEFYLPTDLEAIFRLCYLCPFFRCDANDIDWERDLDKFDF